MSDSKPPPLQTPTDRTQSRRSLKATTLVLFAMLLVGLPVGLRLLGLARTFSVPTGAMTPAVSPGDRVLSERISYLSRTPKRSDIIVFRSDSIPLLPPGIYVKRVIGEPGDHVALVDGDLFINGIKTSLTNASGEINFLLPQSPTPMSVTTNTVVPQKSYFVMGDNSTNSFDSRSFGVVPAKDIIGRVAICYWPLSRVGVVK